MSAQAPAPASSVMIQEIRDAAVCAKRLSDVSTQRVERIMQVTCVVMVTSSSALAVLRPANNCWSSKKKIASVS